MGRTRCLGQRQSTPLLLLRCEVPANGDLFVAGIIQHQVGPGHLRAVLSNVLCAPGFDFDRLSLSATALCRLPPLAHLCSLAACMVVHSAFCLMSVAP